MTARHFPDAARRARLARRLLLHPEHRLEDPAEVARALVAFHATDLPTIHLAHAARSRSSRPADVTHALERRRSLVTLPSLRRTLFAFPRETVPAVLGSVSARMAGPVRASLARDLERHGVAPDGAAWIDATTRAIVATLADGVPRATAALRVEVPALGARTVPPPNARRWETPRSFAAPLLGLLTAEGVLCRGPNAGDWRVHRQQWVLAEQWLGEAPRPVEARAGYAELVRGWLASFGPGTEADLVWWLGATRTAVRAALGDVGAVTVALDSGATGYVLPGEDEPDEPAGPWAALLPTLDPATMGWRERGFLLADGLAPYAYDTVGNGVATAWVDGRIVGTWTQDADARVTVHPRSALAVADTELLDAEAARLTAFLDGLIVPDVYADRLRAGVPLR